MYHQIKNKVSMSRGLKLIAQTGRQAVRKHYRPTNAVVFEITLVRQWMPKVGSV